MMVGILVPILCTLIVFGSIVAIVALPMYFRERTKQSAHKLVSEAISKGQTLDPALMERLTDSMGKRQSSPRRTLGSADQIVDRWRALGFRYVLVYDTGVRLIEASADNGYDPSDWTELERLRGLLKPVATYGSAYSLYAVP